jgi:hypothetical protein
MMNSSISIGFLFSAFLASFFTILCFSTKGYALGGGETLDGQHHHHTVQITSLLPSSVCSTSTKDHSKKGSLNVVHKHGPCSHLNQSQANTPTITQILTRDQSRVNSIQYRIGLNAGPSDLDDSQVTIPAKSGRTIGSGNYIVTLGLGTPKKDQSLIFDTGSDLSWIQCQPCMRACYQQQEPIFNPSASKSYKNITCNSAECSQLTAATGNTPGCSTSTCIYGIQYGDSSFSVGYFGTETLTLTSSNVFPNFLFGCGQNNQGLFGGAAGLLGLGRNQVSVVSQTASKFGKYFSYCLPSPTSSGTLSFGKGGTTSSSLKFTPLLQDSQFYYFDITGIKLAGKSLSISPTVFKTAGSIIDSGTVITRLPPAAYTALKSAFRQAMTKYPSASAVSILDTCYDLSNYKSVSIPTVSFVFGGNVEVPLDAQGILYAVKASQVCLAFAGNTAASDVGIFGNVQQQTLDVVYDIAGGKLGFGSGGCS